MTPDIKQKYEVAAKEYEENNASFSSNPADWVIEGFLAGAAHAEKEAHNRAIGDAIKLVNSMILNDHLISRSVVPELEKLKKP